MPLLLSMYEIWAHLFKGTLFCSWLVGEILKFSLKLIIDNASSKKNSNKTSFQILNCHSAFISDQHCLSTIVGEFELWLKKKKNKSEEKKIGKNK